MNIIACLPHLFILFKTIKDRKLDTNRIMGIFIRAILSFFLIILASQAFSFFFEQLPFYSRLAMGITLEEGLKSIGLIIKQKKLNKKEVYLFNIVFSMLENFTRSLTMQAALLTACIYTVHASFSMVFFFFVSSSSSKKAGIILGIFFATAVHFIYDALTYKMNLVVFLLLVFFLRLSLTYFLNTLPNETDCSF